MRNYNLTKDRERRPVKAPSRYGYADIMAYAFSVVEEMETDEPKTYHDAMTRKDKEQWLFAMKEEIQFLYKNQTWRLVNRPNNHKVIGCKWVFKRKLEAVGTNKLRFKTRLVAQRFTQRE